LYVIFQKNTFFFFWRQMDKISSLLMLFNMIASNTKNDSLRGGNHKRFNLKTYYIS
jgi:hypothetical protein